MADSDAEDLVADRVEHGAGPDRHFGEEGARLTYGSYLRIDNLLDQQHLESDPPAHDALRYAAGNFYVNDKPTGAVVGQQPFGGARASGTNDKAGSMWNLIRWVSPRTVKETLVPATDYRYPFLAPDA